jgi:membrane fusion protein, heavy metal efflux system
MIRRTSLIPFCLFGLVLASAFAGCRKQGASPATMEAAERPATTSESGGPTTVRLTPAAMSEAGIATWQVTPVDVAHRLVLTGSVSFDENRTLQVAANVKGRAAAIPVDLGARVRRGDPLVVVESIELGRAREDLVRARAELNVAERAYARAQALTKAKAISDGEFQSREGDYLSKKSAAAAAERTLHLMGESDERIARLAASPDSHDADGVTLTIRAPFDGRVIDRKIAPGALFEALQPLLTVSDLSTVWVFLDLQEKDLALVSEGLPITMRSDAYPNDSFAGRVDVVGSAVDASTRTVKVRAVVRNPDLKLKQGMFVKAQIEVPRPAAEARASLSVPQGAIQTMDGRPVVFVMTSPGLFARRQVETGHTLDGFTEILAGLRKGDAIVTEGSFILKSEFVKASLVDKE